MVCVACRVPARRPGGFHLRPQMKVTKAKGLNAKPLSSFFPPRTPGPAGHLEPPPPIEATAHSTRPRCASAGDPANLRGRGFARPAPPSARWVRCAARAPSGPLGRVSAACRTHERCCIEGLCFGDFHLAHQMKVTRPPGRNPASNANRNPSNKPRQASVHNGPSPVHCAPPTAGTATRIKTHPPPSAPAARRPRPRWPPARRRWRPSRASAGSSRSPLPARPSAPRAQPSGRR